MSFLSILFDDSYILFLGSTFEMNKYLEFCPNFRNVLDDWKKIGIEETTKYWKIWDSLLLLLFFLLKLHGTLRYAETFL